MSHIREAEERDVRDATESGNGTEDDWVHAFARRHDVWPRDVALSWVELRRTHAVVRALDATLGSSDRAELESWAENQFYSDPRPPTRPPPARLRLADAAATGWRLVTFIDAD